MEQRPKDRNRDDDLEERKGIYDKKGGEGEKQSRSQILISHWFSSIRIIKNNIYTWLRLPLLTIALCSTQVCLRAAAIPTLQPTLHSGGYRRSSLARGIPTGFHRKLCTRRSTSTSRHSFLRERCVLSAVLSLGWEPCTSCGTDVSTIDTSVIINKL